jgi:hypothetical protein
MLDYVSEDNPVTANELTNKIRFETKVSRCPRSSGIRSLQASTNLWSQGSDRWKSSKVGILRSIAMCNAWILRSGFAYSI